MSGSRRVRILTDEQREARRVASRQRRAQRSDEQKQAERDRARQRRAAMTDEQKEAERQRERHRARDRRERERESRLLQDVHLLCVHRLYPIVAPVTTSAHSLARMAVTITSNLTTSAHCLRSVRTRDVVHCASLERRCCRCAAMVGRRCYLLSLLCLPVWVIPRS